MNKKDVSLSSGIILLLLANVLLNNYLIVAVMFGIVGYLLMRESDFESRTTFITYCVYIVLGITTLRIGYFFFYMIYATN
jgi:hypothetical protein